MPYNTEIAGTELFSVNERFSEGRGYKIDGVISEWLSDDTLLVYRLESSAGQPKDTLPLKTEFTHPGDFIIKTVSYRVNASYRRIADFDSVSATSDSIFINLVIRNGETEVLRFPLGGTLVTTRSDTIVHVAVSARLVKRMDFVYKNQDGSFTSGLPEVGTIWYDLTPAKKISSIRLNKRKIFWDEAD